MQHAYTGNAYSNAEIAQALDAQNLSYETLDDDALCRRAARLIAEGHVVGWFQGRMEWGRERWATAASWPTRAVAI